MIFALNEEARHGDDNLQKLDTLVPAALDRMYELSNKSGGLLGTSTGFKDLDKKLQGLQKGDLIVVAGRPSMGKNLFCNEHSRKYFT